jgi:hypothetical protein
MHLRSTIRSLSSDLPVLSGTLLLYLAGRFEHFVRMAFQGLCDGFAARCQCFDDLPEKMRENLRQLTAEVCGSPSKFGFDSVQARAFLVNFANNITASGGLGQVITACFSVTQNNMTPGILADLYKRIGVGGLWSDLAKQAPLKTFLGISADGDTEREAKARLEELMGLRNQIAHPSATPTFPDPDKFDAFIGYVRILAETLTAVTHAGSSYYLCARWQLNHPKSSHAAR